MLLLATLATPSLSGAQDSWPARPVKIVVPFAPGGSVDVVIRKIAQKLTEQTHQSFIVENKAGASGTIGAMQVIRSEHDGYTLLANDTTYPLLPHIFKKLPFDYAHDLLPISAFVFAPTTLVVSKASPYKTLDELLAQARAHPGIVTYGSGGAGTLPHFAGEALAIETRSQLLHVPFKGAAEAIQAVLSNTVDAQFASPSVVLGNVRGGKLRMLAVSGDMRMPLFPEVPTFAEAGIKNFSIFNWTGLWAPKGTPPSVLRRLKQELAVAMRSEDMRAFAENVGAEPRQLDGDAFARLLKESTARWGAVASKADLEKQ
jgi:tripartite-type tricarboxylate transporter receptor subunit TctC